MTFSRLEYIDVRHLTTNQPFNGGLILMHKGLLVVALFRDPASPKKGTAYRVRGIGGRQEPGETIWECALREAREKVAGEFQLRSSTASYFHNIDSGEVYAVKCNDTPAPLLLERQSNLYPYTPLRPRLPSGPYTYFGQFLAHNTAQDISLQAGGDAQGLLLIPLECWPLLQQQPALEEILQHGVQIIENNTLARDSQLWIHPDGSFGMIATLLKQHPELLQA